MGTWGVAWSTLPMWEKTRGGWSRHSLRDRADRTDVRITYTPLEGEGDAKFDSEVSSHKRSAGPESKPSTGTSSLSRSATVADGAVKGSETLTPE
jgi:hypothetical protein